MTALANLISQPLINPVTGGLSVDGNNITSDGVLGNLAVNKVTAAAGSTITAGGLTVTAGGLTVTAGTTALNGTVLQLNNQSSIATPTGSAQTIATSNFLCRTAPSGACTNAILAAGTVNGQLIIVTNENVASTANTITFNSTIATANVINDGTNPQVIKCGTAKMFVWLTSLNSGNGAWVPLEPFAG